MTLYHKKLSTGWVLTNVYKYDIIQTLTCIKKNMRETETTTRIYPDDLQYIKMQARKRGKELVANISIPQMIHQMVKDHRKSK